MSDIWFIISRILPIRRGNFPFKLNSNEKTLNLSWIQMAPMAKINGAKLIWLKTLKNNLKKWMIQRWRIMAQSMYRIYWLLNQKRSNWTPSRQRHFIGMCRFEKYNKQRIQIVSNNLWNLVNLPHPACHQLISSTKT